MLLWYNDDHLGNLLILYDLKIIVFGLEYIILVKSMLWRM